MMVPQLLITVPNLVHFIVELVMGRQSGLLQRSGLRLLTLVRKRRLV